MKVSVSKGNQNFKPVDDSFVDFATHMTFYNYSMSTFKDNDRKNKNFLFAEAVALDFDGGLTIAEAKLRFAQYQHIIAPTRSHQVVKHGIKCDRFRVVIPLDKPVDSIADYEETVKALLKANPEADKACKDPARMFYPSTHVESIRYEGQTIPTRKAKPKEKKEPTKAIIGQKGKLLPDTLRFLLFGAPAGERNHTLFAAAKDMQGQGYTIGEATLNISNMIEHGGDWAHSDLSEKDIETIENAYSTETKDDVRVKDRPSFNFQSIGDLYEADLKVEWLAKELLIAGGISLLAARPKSGKSTLVRQLAKAVCKGEEFLGREVEKGRVAYLALEEHPAMLQHQFKTIGLTKDDDIMLHVGPIYGKNRADTLIGYLKDYEAKLVVIDTLALFAGIEDSNSYDKVNKSMEQVRRIARETNSHVMLIHHTTKSDVTSTNSIMGSQAYLGAVDTAMIINCTGPKRFLTSVGRGLSNFNNCEILFDKEKETYTLGVELDTEF